jgi:hypothetical protein
MRPNRRRSCISSVITTQSCPVNGCMYEAGFVSDLVLNDVILLSDL